MPISGMVLVTCKKNVMIAFMIRDWSLITGKGATKWEGGHVKFTPTKKGSRKCFSYAEGGHKFGGNFYIVA